MEKMIKKNNLYFPSEEFKKNAWINNKNIYKEAEKDPVKFWEGIAKELVWKKTWKKAFLHNPPYFKWFDGGKINITENCLDRNLENNGDKPALIWEPEAINEKAKIFTYSDLSKKVNRFANVLKSIGVKKGDCVGIYLPMIPEVIISMLACARIGAVHSIIFSAFSSPALSVRLKATKAKILITADGYHRAGKIKSLKEKADIALEEKNEVEKIIVVKRVNNKICWKDGRDFWWNDLIEKENDICEVEVMDSEDNLFVLPESGTQGQFLPILHTTGGYAVQAYITGKWIFDLHPNDVFWSTADMGWITGHTYGCYAPLLNGVTTLIFEGSLNYPNLDRWAQIIEKYKVTQFYTAPTAIRMFREYGEDCISKYSFDSLKVLGSVGEPIDESAWEWYFKKIGKEKCPIVDTWWQTETGSILISSLPGVGPFKPAFTGLPFPGIKIDILAHNEVGDKIKSCTNEEQGNLVILPPFAPGLLRDIYNNSEKYSEIYWSKYGNMSYFTSDSALRDENGLIRVIGRVDDVIKVAGRRLGTGELEAAVTSHPEINECAIIGVPDRIKGETPIVFAIYKGNKNNEDLKKEIVEQIEKEVGPIAFPKKVYLVEDLPKTRSGKIMRNLLKGLFLNGQLGNLAALSNPDIVEHINKTIRND